MTVNSLPTLACHTLLVIGSFISFVFFFMESFEVRGSHTKSCVESLENSTFEGTVLVNVVAFALTLVMSLTVTRYFKYHQLKPVNGGKVRWAALLDWGKKSTAAGGTSNGDDTRTKGFKLVLFIAHCVSIGFLSATFAAVRDDDADGTMCKYKPGDDENGFNPSAALGSAVGFLSFAILIEVVVLVYTLVNLKKPSEHFDRHAIEYISVSTLVDRNGYEVTPDNKARAKKWLEWASYRHPVLFFSAVASYILFVDTVNQTCNHGTILSCMLLLLTTLFSLGVITTNNTRNTRNIQLIAIGTALASFVLYVHLFWNFIRGPSDNMCYEDSKWIQFAYFVSFAAWFIWAFMEILLQLNVKDIKYASGGKIKSENDQNPLISNPKGGGNLPELKPRADLTFV